MNSITVMANVVSIVVVIFVAVAFITLTIFYFNAQKKIIANRLEDDVIRKEVRERIIKNRKHYSSVEEAERYFAKKEKHQALYRRAAYMIFIIMYIVFFGMIIFSNLISESRHIWFGDVAMLTIKTDSMATAYKSNEYLFNENGETDENDRIPQFCFITISKKEGYKNSLQVGDIAAFTMDNGDGETEITVVHRIIDIETDKNGDPIFTFRGDANPKSMSGEYAVSGDRIVGVFETDGFSGVKNHFLGHFISYLQSGTGIAMITIALLLIFIYSVLSDKLDKVYDGKYAELQKCELEKIFLIEDFESEKETTGGRAL